VLDAPREPVDPQVDALHDDAAIDDALWAALRGEFDEARMIELIVLAGFYHMVSFVTNGLHLPLEDGAARFPA
jgi:alkylhydroperoxidase family enzyme